MGISIVIPVFNSKDTLFPLTKRIFDLYHKFDLEIIFIDDGSEDGTKEILEKLKMEYGEIIKLVFHKNNLGEHSAIYSGFQIAQKKWAITLAADYQNPPEEILKLVLFAELQDFDVVYGKFIKKEHPFWKNILSKIVDILATILIKKPKNIPFSNFKCISEKVYKKIVKKNSYLPLIDLAILKETNNIGIVRVIHQKRLIGVSAYNLKRYISLILRILYNVTPTPFNNFILKIYSRYFPVLI